MDFLNMNFSSLFRDKHGDTIYKNITEKILLEKPIIDSDKYIEVIFKFAFLDFFGLDLQIIKRMVEDIMETTNIDVSDIKETHKNSINLIQNYLLDSINKKKNNK